MPKDRSKEAEASKYGLIVVWANEYADDPKQDWPGMPLSTMPHMARGELQAAIRDGKVRIVERPARIMASGAKPTGTRKYIAPVR